MVSAVATREMHEVDSAVRQGIRDAVPVIGGLAPLGLALGAAIGDSGVAAPIGLSSSALIYGASAQLAAIQVLVSGAGLIPVAGAVAAVNVRTLAYSAALRRSMRTQPRWFRWFGPYFLVDPLFALVSARQPELHDGASVRHYYLAAGLAIWLAWQPLVLLGLLAGPLVPVALSLEFAPGALMLGLLAPALRSRRAVVAATGGGLTALLTGGMGGGAGILLAGMAGASIASLACRRWP